ncbi:hypothetical protein [Actinoplanes sp. NPDC049599]|uniref:hypothetical protein n=1 Tax=Actinoplanes sp. NPDC049599 TaxID=3363903 RepID=UPI003788E0F9
MTDIDRPRPSAARALIWTLLGLCTVGNLALSLYGGPLAVHAVLGVATLLCIAALIATAVRARR